MYIAKSDVLVTVIQTCANCKLTSWFETNSTIGKPLQM